MTNGSGTAVAEVAFERSIRNEVRIEGLERRVEGLEHLRDDAVAAVFRATLWAVTGLGGVVLTAVAIIYAMAR